MTVRTLILASALTSIPIFTTAPAVANEPGLRSMESTWSAQVRAASAADDGFAGLHDSAITDRDRQSEWRLRNSVYVGNEQGDLGGFGVKWRVGGTEMALTRKGMGWRWRF